MLVHSPVTPVFYTLPKIHKDYVNIPTGRSIVAAIGSLTEKISAFIDYFLQPCVSALPSYTKDSNDFLKTLQNVPPSHNHHWLVTMDIESLYTNVPVKGGLRAAEVFLQTREHTSPPSDMPSTACILELMEIVLTTNYFMFDSDYFLQVSGVSMGSKMSPSFASLHVGLFEQETVLNPAKNPYLQFISIYKRYFDDIFFIWTSAEDKLHEFHQFMNTHNSHLNFTMSHDQRKRSFLDILVINNRDGLSTSLYRKPTDRNSILHGQSCHPTSLKKSLPVAQFHRIRRICSSDQDFQEKATDLKNRFLTRGYKEEWVTQASERFAESTQTHCVPNTRRKTTEKRLTCAIPYSPLSHDISSLVRKHWHVISTDPSLKTQLSEPPRVVFKRPPNLRNMLVRADCIGVISGITIREAQSPVILIC